MRTILSTKKLLHIVSSSVGHPLWSQPLTLLTAASVPCWASVVWNLRLLLYFIYYDSFTFRGNWFLKYTTTYLSRVAESPHQVSDLSVRSSLVTTTERSPPPRWLATTEPTPPLRCFTVFSAVFLDAVFWKLPITSAASFDPCMNARQPHVRSGD